MSQERFPSFGPALTVLEYVRGALRDFKWRQEARALKRKQDRARWKQTPADQKRKRVTGMRVMFRAEFAGPVGRLNPMGLGCSKLRMVVDVFRKGDRWFARSGKHTLKLESGPTHGTVKDTVREGFERQLTDWILLDADAKPLDPASVEEDPQGNFLPVELTHVALMTGPLSQANTQGANYFKTACGAEVHVRLIKSVRAQLPPTCKVCREEWKKTKPEDRFK